MATVDRSEEIYARVAAIPLRRRVTYDLIGFVPFIVLVVCMISVTGRCKGDPEGFAFGASIVAMLLSCIGVVAAAMWWLLSHPQPLRYFARFERKSRSIYLFIVALATFLLISKTLHPFFAKIDAEHINYCEQRHQLREAADL